MLAGHHVSPDQDVAVAGSGGMAKAVVAALRDAGFTRVTVVARTLERGTALAERYGFTAVTSLGESRPGVLVNATPVGMAGGAEAGDLSFPEEVVRAASTVLDVVYLPSMTPLVLLASSLGLEVLTGGEVSKLQALDQFVLYTGVRPTDEQVDRAEEYATA
jgi:shikimate dehydrogenase